MKTLQRILISTALLALPLSAMADNNHHRGNGHGKHAHKHHDKHHRHNGHHGHRPHFQHHEHHVYHHDRRHHGYYDHQVRQERVYVPAVVHAPVVAYPRQGVTIHGNVHVPF
jgi:hypothetical protein